MAYKHRIKIFLEKQSSSLPISVFFRVPKLLSHSFFFRVPFDKVTIFLLIIQYSARVKVRSVLGRKYIRIPLSVVFYPLISWSWDFANCKLTVLCLQSKRKILIWSTIGRNIPSLIKKRMLEKIFILSKKFILFLSPFKNS